jgi:antitoxin (DNA-binding transcriptional repressor) of toxin-antitoxin stability system
VAVAARPGDRVAVTVDGAPVAGTLVELPFL